MKKALRHDPPPPRLLASIRRPLACRSVLADREGEVNAYAEEEAKTKWCPFARQLDWDENQSGGMPISANRHFDGAPHKATMCIGSSCMAWRSGPDKTVWDDKGNADFLPRGYCGLAGKP